MVTRFAPKAVVKRVGNLFLIIPNVHVDKNLHELNHNMQSSYRHGKLN